MLRILRSIQLLPRVAHCLLFALVVGCWAAQPLGADESTDPVSAGESALRDLKAPWYDAEEDAVRIISLQDESDAGDRQDWQKSKTKRPEWDWDWDWDCWRRSPSGTGTAGGGFRFPTFGELVQFLGWLLLFVVLGGLIYALVRSFLKFEPDEAPLRKGVSATEEDRTDEQRIRELPVQPATKKGDFLSMAQSHYEAGQFADAIVYLFSHRLLQLDRAGFIRLTRGKTNRQYLFEISRSQHLRKILGQTIVCFEDVFFGKHDLPKDRFERTWRDNHEFDAIIRKGYE